jgi:hypothetical protein
MSVTNYARNQIMDYNFGSTSYSLPSVYYMGLSTTTITASGSTATEPTGGSGGGYARIPINNNKVSFSTATGGCIINSGSLAFPESTTPWGTITYIGLWDALTSGSLWYFEALSSPKIIQDYTTIVFSASAITISMT